MADRPDLIVVGAGIIGLACAFEARLRGLDVAVVDRAERPFAGTSAVAGGMLAPLCEAPELPEVLVRLALDGARAWPGWAARLAEHAGRDDVGLYQTGTLLVASDRDERVELEHAAQMLSDHGLTFERVPVRQLRRDAPHLTPRLAAGWRAPDDHHVEPRRVGEALVAALHRLGVPLHLGVSLTALQDVGHGVALHRGDDAPPLQAHRVLVAAGAHTATLLREHHPLPLRPVKGQLVELSGEALLPCVVRTPRVYLIPRAPDRLAIGASSEEMGFDTQPTAGEVMRLLQEAWRVLPGVFDLALDHLRVGLRPALPDGLPALGPAGSERILVATGHHRHGVLLAAITATRVGQALTGGRDWPAAFHPRRLAG